MLPRPVHAARGVSDRLLASYRAGSAWPTVLTAWLAARVIVLAALAVARFLHRTLDTGRRYDGLLGWDADWYRRIAEHGYDQLPHEALRFFPLLPMTARALAGLPGVSVGLALLVLSNGFALAYGVLLHRLARHEGLSQAAAGRVVWAAMLAPAGFVLVMGYAEPWAGVLLAGIFLLARTRRWWPAAGLGLLAGALRPTGVVVAVFVAVEAGRSLRDVSARELGGRLAAVVAPLAGLAGYLLWVGARFGEPLAPFQVQASSTLRGAAFVDPLVAGRAAVSGLLAGQLPSQAPHLLWVLTALALLGVCARRLPAAYTCFAAAVIVLGVTARDLQSFERYAAGAVPLLLAIGVVSAPRPLRVAVAAGAGAALAGYTLLSALHLYVP